MTLLEMNAAVLTKFIAGELKIGLAIFGITTVALSIWVLIYLIKRKD